MDQGSPRILGTYMLERELSNAFNDIVAQGETFTIVLIRQLVN